MRPVLLTGFVKYNKALSVVVMQRITRLRSAAMGYIECTQDCRLTARYFTESIYRGKLIVLGVCTMAPCYERGEERKKKKEGKEEINATYGVIVRVIASLYEASTFCPNIFQLVTIEFFSSKEESSILASLDPLARMASKREGRARKNAKMLS